MTSMPIRALALIALSLFSSTVRAEGTAQDRLISAVGMCLVDKTEAALADPSVDVNGKNEYGEALLYDAASEEYIDADACSTVGMLLLAKGAQVDAMGSSGKSALHAALETGKTQLAIELLKRGAKDVADNQELPALVSAVKGPSAEVFRFLVERGDDLATTENDKSLLMLAAEYDRLESLDLLLQKGLDPAAVDSEGKTALFHAMYGRAQFGLGDRPNTPPSQRIVKRLIEAGAVVDVRANDGSTPLMAAAKRALYPTEVTAVIQYLLSQGASATAASNNALTALHFTVEQGYLEASRTLLEVGAEVNAAASDSGKTPLHIAVNPNGIPSLEIVKLLVEKGADVQALAKGESVLILTLFRSSGDQSELVSYLLSQGADPKLLSLDGGTTIMYAAAKKQPKVIQLLIDAGVDPHFVRTPQNGGGNALTLAARSRIDESVRILLAVHADPNVPLTNGDSALMYSSNAGSLVSVAALVDAGADVNARNLAGGYALKFARGQGFTAIVDYLVAHGAHD